MKSTPTQETFSEVRDNAIALWKEVDSDNDKYGYATGKINRIKDLEATSENLMYILNMFDISNQCKLVVRISEHTFNELCVIRREWELLDNEKLL